MEIKRARMTKMLSEIKEASGDIHGACDVLQELQIETFGSMEKREKIEFLLEQMRLCLLKGDYTRTVIISRKINVKYLKEPELKDLSKRYYALMIDFALHEGMYLDVCKYYFEIVDWIDSDVKVYFC